MCAIKRLEDSELGAQSKGPLDPLRISGNAGYYSSEHTSPEGPSTHHLMFLVAWTIHPIEFGVRHPKQWFFRAVGMIGSGLAAAILRSSPGSAIVGGLKGGSKSVQVLSWYRSRYGTDFDNSERASPFCFRFSG